MCVCVTVCGCCYSKQKSGFLTSLFCPQSASWLTARVTVQHSSLCLSLSPWQLAATKTSHLPHTWDQEEGSTWPRPCQIWQGIQVGKHTQYVKRVVNAGGLECCNSSTWSNKTKYCQKWKRIKSGWEVKRIWRWRIRNSQLSQCCIIWDIFTVLLSVQVYSWSPFNKSEKLLVLDI